MKKVRPAHSFTRKAGAIVTALAIPALLAATPVAAKTLVYCSEGSPENFYPAVNTTGTSFDANSQIYSRIVDFERGATTVVPYCMKDFRGYAAISLLQTSGAPRIGAIDGFGLAAWKAAKLPLAGTTGGMDDAAALEALQKEIDGR